MSDKEFRRVSELDRWKQALMYRAAENIGAALRRGQTTADFLACAEGEKFTFEASLLADPVSTEFCIYVHEKNTGRFVCRSDAMALDSLRSEDDPGELWFNHDLDDTSSTRR